MKYYIKIKPEDIRGEFEVEIDIKKLAPKEVYKYWNCLESEECKICGSKCFATCSCECHNPTPKPSKDLTPQDVLMNQAIDDTKNEIHPIIDTKPSRCKACACFCAIGCQCSCHIIKSSKEKPKYKKIVELQRITIDKYRKALEEIAYNHIGGHMNKKTIKRIAKLALKDA